jgi:hypothetical protein
MEVTILLRSEKLIGLWLALGMTNPRRFKDSAEVG